MGEKEIVRIAMMMLAMMMKKEILIASLMSQLIFNPVVQVFLLIFNLVVQVFL